MSYQNNFEIARAFARLQQQQGQQVQGNNASLPSVPIRQHQPSLPAAADQGANSLSTLLARHLQQASYAAGLGVTSATAAASANQSIAHSSSSPSSVALSQEMLESIRLIASVDPGLAAAAINHVLSLKSQQDQQKKQHLQQHQHFSNQSHPSPQSQQRQISNNTNGIASTSVGHPLPHASSKKAQKKRSLDLIRAHLASSDQASLNSMNRTNQGVPGMNVSSGAASELSHPLGKVVNHEATKNKAALETPTAEPAVILGPPQNWSLKQLETYVKQLRVAQQPIPESIAVVLNTHRRKQEKHNARRIANNKSAVGSRARKKAQIDQMALENKRLKRHFSILSFLPDPVMTVSATGEITFVSMQMERVLQHNEADLIGSNIEMFVAPDSKKELRRMIRDLVFAEQQALLQCCQEDMNNSSASEHTITSQSLEVSAKTMDEKIDSCGEMSELSDGRFSKKSFLDTEVDMEEDGPPPAKKAKMNNDAVISDSVSAKHADAIISRRRHINDKVQKKAAELKLPPKKLQQAKFLQSCFRRKQSSSSNSSLSKTETQSMNSSESGYSPEMSDSLASTMSNDTFTLQKQATTLHRPTPVAPSCNICLIRNDLSTVWCELTASIRTRSIEDGDCSAEFLSKLARYKSNEGALEREMKELLLCFRPITQTQESKADEKLRFCKKVRIKTPSDPSA